MIYITKVCSFGNINLKNFIKGARVSIVIGRKAAFNFIPLGRLACGNLPHNKIGLAVKYLYN